MSNLYKVKDEALVEGGQYYRENRTGVEKHGWFWTRAPEDRELYKSIATGGTWVWYDEELEELG